MVSLSFGILERVPPQIGNKTNYCVHELAGTSFNLLNSSWILMYGTMKGK